MKEQYVEYISRDLEVLIPSFMENTREEIANLEQAVRNSDFKLAFRMGHSIKGSGANYGFMTLSEIGRKIERSAHEGDMDAVNKGLAELKIYVEQVRIVLE